MSVDLLSDLTTMLDEATIDPRQWPSILENLARATGSQGAIFLRVDEVAEASIATTSLTNLIDRYFSDGWHTIDHRLAAIPLMRQRGISVDQDFTTREEFETLPYYQDFLRPHGLRWFAGIGFQTNHTFWCLTLQKTAKQGLFEHQEQSRLVTLVPALRRAALLTSAVEKARVAGMTDAFDLIGCAAMILSDNKKVIRWNDAFANLFGEDLSVVGDRLLTRDASANAVIGNLSSFPDRQAPSAFAVRRTNKSPIAIHVVPLGRETRRAFNYGSILLVARSPEIGPVPAATLLQAAYGLTKAEARVAIALAEGVSLNEVSQRFSVALSTIRTQVRSIFVKLNISRQSELIRIISALSLK